MNVWRCVGISFFFLGALALIGTTKLPSFGADKKTTTAEKKTAEEVKKSTTVEKAKEAPPKTTAAPPTGGEKLTFKAFEKGKTFYQIQKTDTTQKMTVNTQEVTQTQEQTFVIAWTCKDIKDGTFIVTQKIVGVKMKINIGGNQISYDSTNAANPKNPMTDFFQQLTKSELTYYISEKKLTVDKVEGRDEFIKGLSDINPQMQGLLKAILSSKALEKMAEPTWWAYPPEGVVSKDAKWDRKSELDLGPIGTYKTNFEFKYNGKKDNKDIIGITTKLEYSAPQEKQGLPFIIHSAKLSSDSGTGEAVFDNAKGRFESSKIKMKLTGQLEIEVGNMRTTVELNQDQEATSTTSDTDPWAKK